MSEKIEIEFFDEDLENFKENRLAVVDLTEIALLMDFMVENSFVDSKKQLLKQFGELNVIELKYNE